MLGTRTRCDSPLVEGVLGAWFGDDNAGDMLENGAEKIVARSIYGVKIMAVSDASIARLAQGDLGNSDSTRAFVTRQFLPCSASLSGKRRDGEALGRARFARVGV